jgi:acetyl esterase/lipase
VPGPATDAARNRVAPIGEHALSPLFADLRGIAPVLIQCGSNEVLLDDARRLALAAAAADAAVQPDVTPDVGHVFRRPRLLRGPRSRPAWAPSAATASGRP